MTTLVDANNAASRLIHEGRLDEAERALDQIEALLQARAAVDVTIPATELDFVAAWDELIYSVHRVTLGLRRGAHVQSLPHAERAWALEKAVYAAVMARKRGELQAVTSYGGWALLRCLELSHRLDEAAQIFEDVMGSEEYWTWFTTAYRNNREYAENFVVIGLAAYCNRRDAERLKSGRTLIQNLEVALRESKNPLPWYFIAGFWSLTRRSDRAFAALERAFEYGCTRESALEAAAFAGLREDERWVSRVVPSYLIWSLTSAPSGARIRIDGVLVGDTPHRMQRPPPGTHRLRFELDGYLPQDVTIDVSPDDRTGPLAIDHQFERAPLSSTEREEIDAAWVHFGHGGPSVGGPPVLDAAARARTRAFLGDPSRAIGGFARQTTYGLGGLSMVVHGNGTATLHKQAFGSHEREFTVTLALEAPDVERLFGAFVEEAFTEMVTPNEPGLPDMISVALELTNSAGERHRVSRFVVPPHAGFDRLIAAFYAATGKYLTAEQKLELR